eukprot:scaffold9864_cov124-Isochrysis_galbana.AAC.7
MTKEEAKKLSSMRSPDSPWFLNRCSHAPRSEPRRHASHSRGNLLDGHTGGSKPGGTHGDCALSEGQCREWYRHSRLHGNGGGYQLSGRMRTTIVSAHTCILRYPVSVIRSLCEYPHTGPSIRIQ